MTTSADIAETWTDKIEKEIRDIKEACKKHAWAHEKLAQKHKKNDRVLSMLIIVISASTGTLIPYFKSTLGETDIAIISTVILYIIATLTGVNSYLASADKMAKNNIAASNFDSIKANIKKQLAIDKNRRQKADDYYDWISRDFGNSVKNSPSVYENLLKKYAADKKVKNLDDTKKIQ